MKDDELRAKIAALRAELASLEATLKRRDDEAWRQWQRERKAAVDDYDAERHFAAYPGY